MSESYSLLFGVYLRCDDDIRLRTIFSSLINDSYPHLKSFVFPTLDESSGNKYRSVDVIVVEQEKYKASLPGSYIPWLLATDTVTVPFVEDDWEFSLHSTLNRISVVARFIPVKDDVEVTCLNIPWMITNIDPTQFDTWTLSKYCSILMSYLDKMIKYSLNRPTSVEVGVSSPGEGTSTDILATDGEYGVGVSTTKAPTVTQVKSDIKMVNDTIRDIETYTNPKPSTVTLGGIEAGTTFDNVPIKDIITRFIYKEIFPVLRDPYVDLDVNISEYVEVGSSFNLQLSVYFNRGSISPAFGTDGYRSGLPNKYQYTGPGIPSEVSSTNLKDVQLVTNFSIDEVSEVTWTCKVSYDGGDQPLTNENNLYREPLVAGTTQPVSVTIKAIYPTYATITDISDLSKIPLDEGEYIEVEMVSESETQKQTIQYPSTASNQLKGIQQLNTISGSWEWLGGEQVGSTTSFEYSEITRQINGNDIQYRQYTNNGAKIGSRELRFYI